MPAQEWASDDEAGVAQRSAGTSLAPDPGRYRGEVRGDPQRGPGPPGMAGGAHDLPFCRAWAGTGPRPALRGGGGARETHLLSASRGPEPRMVRRARAGGAGGLALETEGAGAAGGRRRPVIGDRPGAGPGVGVYPGWGTARPRGRLLRQAARGTGPGGAPHRGLLPDADRREPAAGGARPAGGRRGDGSLTTGHQAGSFR